MNCPPFVRQYGILLTSGVIYYAKRSSKQTIYARVQEKGHRNYAAGKIKLQRKARRFGTDDKRIAAWERIYLEEGPEGFALERRGRRSTGQPRKLAKAVEEDLLAEVQRLRAENDYLKNLQALVLEDERRQRKKRR